MRNVLQFQAEQLAVPTGILGESVVGQQVRSFLRLAHVRQLNGRHALDTEQAGRAESSVTGDDAAGVIDQHRIGETEPANALGDLPNLLGRVSAGIALVRLERHYWHNLDTQLPEMLVSCKRIWPEVIFGDSISFPAASPGRSGAHIHTGTPQEVTDGWYSASARAILTAAGGPLLQDGCGIRVLLNANSMDRTAECWCRSLACGPVGTAPYGHQQVRASRVGLKPRKRSVSLATSRFLNRHQVILRGQNPSCAAPRFNQALLTLGRKLTRLLSAGRQRFNS